MQSSWSYLQLSMNMFEKYQVIETLGEGTFGKVKLATHQGKYYAIKFTTKNNAYSQQVLDSIFDKEASILEELNHPNIIKLYEAIKSGTYSKEGRQETRSGLVFEYAPYNLGEILQFGPLDETIARTIFRQMISALSYLHSKNIIHRDIKPQNILFDSFFNLKICDFGLSAKLTNDGKPKTVCGSDSFKSPQMLMRKNYNGVMNDLFAAAVTLFILVAAQPPFISALPNTGLYKFIALNYIEKFWAAHEKKVKFSEQLKDLLNSMLAFDPTHRLTIPQILAHPWMTGDVLMQQDLQKEMRRIENQIVEKKRKAMLKNLKSKTLKVAKHANRSLNQFIDVSKSIKKGKYCQQLAKLSDRFIPVLKSYEQLQALLQFLEGDLSMAKQGIQLSKIVNSETGGKVLIQVSIESVDENCDCLKFKLKQGDTFDFVDTLKLFDAQLLEE